MWQVLISRLAAPIKCHCNCRVVGVSLPEKISRFLKKELSCWVVGNRRANTTATQQHVNLLPSALMGYVNVQRVSGAPYAVVHANAVRIPALVAIRRMEHVYAFREGMAIIVISDWNGENLDLVRACHVVLQAHRSLLSGSVLFRKVGMQTSLAFLDRWPWTKSIVKALYRYPGRGSDPSHKLEAVRRRRVRAVRFQPFPASTTLLPREVATVLAAAAHAVFSACLVASLSANLDVMQVPLLKCPSALLLGAKWSRFLRCISASGFGSRHWQL